MRHISGMNKKYVLLGLFVSILIGCTCADALEFSGEVVRLTGAQNENIVWNESNFGGVLLQSGR
ncbi:MAG: hypothetical protein KAU52_05630 [Methanosarcinales archaeon]|nr:hypothetical protein [Methanosarcinales archaeon]